MNQPSHYLASVVDNEQLTHNETERFRLGIYEPDG